MSTIKADTVTTKSSDADLTLTGGGTGVPNLESGFKVGGTAGVPTESIRDDAVTTAKILDANITTAKINDDAVTVAKMAGLARGSVIIGDASGNPAAVTAGTADQVLTSDGTDLSWADAGGGGGFKSLQVFTSSGTWTKPSGITAILVKLVGCGAAGNHSGQGGGAGGYSEKVIDATSLTTETVTLTSSRNGNQAGTTTSFGSHLSATGGELGTASRGGKPGLGSGGDLNAYGGGGDYQPSASGHGGASYFGGPDHGSDTTRQYDVGNNAYGAGGMGIENGYTQYGISRGGLVLVYEFE